MSSLLVKPTVTVADGTRPHVIGLRILTALSSTSIRSDSVIRSLVAASNMTTSGVLIPSTVSLENTQKALGELRRLSGLTWDQLAKLLDVSRGSLHLWASGQPLSRFDEEHLNRLLWAIQYIDRGSANLNRSLLLYPDGNKNSLFDLLVVGQYDEFKRLADSGHATQRVSSKKPSLEPLAKEAGAAYMPQNPADLVDALQDPIHLEVWKSRPARAVRSRKKSSGT
jgi:transcriptional regulator with XRE-family HTH domain